MEEREPQSTWGNMFLFVVLSCLWVLAITFWLKPLSRNPPPEQPAVGQQQTGKEGPSDEGVEQPGPEGPEGQPTPPPGEVAEAQPAEKSPALPEQPAPEPKPKVDVPQRVPPEPRLITLGSLHPEHPYRGMATVTNLAAAAVRFELKSPRFRDLEDRGGYLGHLTLDEIGHLAPDEMARRKEQSGCRVDVVGPGTPAALAGVKPDDLITSVAGEPVSDFRSLRKALQKKKTRPGETVELTVLRGGKTVPLSATLRRRPLEVFRPEKDDPLSFLLTLRRVDERSLDDLLKELEDEKADEEDDEKKSKDGDRERDETIGLELAGLDLRTEAWDIEDEAKYREPGPHDSVTFFRELPEFGLKVSKTFRLAQVPDMEQGDGPQDAYHLILEVKIENTGGEVSQVAYQLDGPTGLPVEGKWYAYKVGRGGGLRDVVKATTEGGLSVAPCRKIASDSWDEIWQDEPVTYIGVDAQYFSAVMIPQKEQPTDVWFAQSEPIRVGPVDKTWEKAANTSCRLVSEVHTLQPGGEPQEHAYVVFAGPKKPELLAGYGLGDVVYYGWFWWVARPMIWVLHGFYWMVGNYGVAIIMLTVLVRGGMFPLSIRQTRGAKKMQELQPEIKKIAEKYKNNPEARMRAQQELFRKHNYNPLSGCLIILLQFPIFIGLYRGLAVDVELRQAPLISESILWCSNLAAPDMLFSWQSFMPGFVAEEPSSGLLYMFFLGPYFNLLPLLTIGLFILQQKLLMPPAADEQQRTQQRMMKFMMVFMGLVFFKVASGLCLYFIATSLWGVAERKLLPLLESSGKKSATSGSRLRRWLTLGTLGKEATGRPAPKASSSGSGGSASPAQPKTAPPKPVQPQKPVSKAPRSGSGPDGATQRKKKKRKKRKKGSRGRR